MPDRSLEQKDADDIIKSVQDCIEDGCNPKTPPVFGRAIVWGTRRIADMPDRIDLAVESGINRAMANGGGEQIAKVIAEKIEKTDLLSKYRGARRITARFFGQEFDFESRDIFRVVAAIVLLWLSFQLFTTQATMSKIERMATRIESNQ